VYVPVILPDAPWFGPLYLATTAPFLGPGLSAAEAHLIAEILRLRPGERVLDLACGTGRHLAALGGMGLSLWGVDRSGVYLHVPTANRAPTANPTAILVQADQRALPFGSCFDAVYSWYSSLFNFDDAANAAALAEAGRVLRPGGRLLVQHANPARLALAPEGRAARPLPGGGWVEEWTRFDVATGRERLRRRLLRGAGQLAGACELRYYRAAEWEPLARGAGLRLRELAATGPAGRAEGFAEESIDLIAVLEKPT